MSVSIRRAWGTAERRRTVNPFTSISDCITERIPAALRHFTEVTDAEPWIHRPDGYRTNRLDGVIGAAANPALLRPRDAACAGSSSGLQQRTVSSGWSRACGFRHRPRALPDARIALYVRHGAPLGRGRAGKRSDRTHGHGAVDLLAAVDPRRSRPAFERYGRWLEVVDQLVDEWAAPPPVSDLARQLDAPIPGHTEPDGPSSSTPNGVRLTSREADAV
jgi:hypothetical protein